MHTYRKYPLESIDEESWRSKVEKTAMYTIPSENEAMPVV